MFGHGINSTLALQPQAGVYNETAFVGLDKVIDAASVWGIKLIITLSDSWNLVDSIKAVRPALRVKQQHTARRARHCALHGCLTAHVHAAWLLHTRAEGQCPGIPQQNLTYTAAGCLHHRQLLDSCLQHAP